MSGMKSMTDCDGRTYEKISSDESDRVEEIEIDTTALDANSQVKL